MNNNQNQISTGYLHSVYQAQLESSTDRYSKFDSSVNTSSSIKQDVWSVPINDIKEEEENENKFKRLAIQLQKCKPWMIGFLIGALLTGIGLAVITTMWIQYVPSSTGKSIIGTTTEATSASTTTPATYWVSGPITNLDPSILLSNGWTECYNGTYSVNFLPSEVATVLSQCNLGKLLLACKPINNSVYTLAAMGLRNDVLYNCSNNVTCTHVANEVGWYFSDSYSWGFVNGTDSVTRNSCDVGSTDPTLRLCWHTGNAYGGYRCGSTTSLNSATTWERSVWQAN